MTANRSHQGPIRDRSTPHPHTAAIGPNSTADNRSHEREIGPNSTADNRSHTSPSNPEMGPIHQICRLTRLMCARANTRARSDQAAIGPSIGPNR